MWRVVSLTLFAVAVVGCLSDTAREAQIHNEEGIYLFRQASYLHAVQCFQAALSLHPNDPDLLFKIAQCHDRLNQPEKAEHWYHRCLREAPNHDPCRHALAALLVRTGRRPEAEQMAEDWLRSQPERAGPYALDGMLRAQAGDLLKARTRLQQALERDPHHYHALTELARLYEQQFARPDRALALYELAYQHHPEYPELRERIRALQSTGVSHPRPD
jgi:Tfp pilus assembly protein PilF